MKKLLAFVAMTFVAGLAVNAMAQNPLQGTYVNSAGKVVIADSAKGETPNNLDVTITDNTGKCMVKIATTTNKVTATGKNGATYQVDALAAVEKADYPNFSLWPEDETIKLAPDALPFDKLDPSCAAFKDNNVFNRQK